MSVSPIRRPSDQRPRPEQRTGRVYAIAFDLSEEAGHRCFGAGDAWKGCYGKIERVLNSHGFQRQQGSVFYGNGDTRATHCFAVVLELSDRYDWFMQVCKDMRMLRIDENDDLLAVIPNRMRFDRPAAAG